MLPLPLHPPPHPPTASSAAASSEAASSEVAPSEAEATSAEYTVYNTTGFARGDVVELGDCKAEALQDEVGNVYPVQKTARVLWRS